MYICKFCSKSFQSSNKNQQFCSIKCARDFSAIQRIEVVCAECGKIEKVNPSRAKNIYVVALPVWDNIIRKDTQKKLHLYVLFVIKNMNVSKVKLITIKLVEILSVEKND